MLLAHAGEDHSSGAEAIVHTAAPWYVALPIYIFALAAIAYITWLLSKKNLGTVLLVVSIVMLLAGFGLYAISPLVSAVAIVGGILIAGFMALSSLSGPQK